MRSAAPTSRARESAASMPMNDARARPRRGVVLRAPGPTRRSRARVTATPPSTRTSSCTRARGRRRQRTPGTRRGSPTARGTPAAVAAPTRKSLAHSARAKPAPAAMRPRTRFSATICRTIRDRLAPRARRVANSCCRSSAPPMSNPAALPQATNSSATTAAASAYSDGRTSRVSCSSNPATVTPVPVLVSGCSSRERIGEDGELGASLRRP